MKFLSDVVGTISDNDNGKERRESLTKYIVLTDEGDFFLSGITHGELVKLAGRIMAVAMENAMLYKCAGIGEYPTYDDEEFQHEVAGMMEAAISCEGKL